MKHLHQDGYVEGLHIVQTLGDGDGVRFEPDFMITPKGIEYLDDNTTMAKAKEFVMKMSCIAPWFT